MGEIFDAMVFRPDTLEYARADAHKYNCYSNADGVKMMHHYLRQGPWKVCFRGEYSSFSFDDFKSGIVSPSVIALIEGDRIESYIEYDHKPKSHKYEVLELYSQWKDVQGTGVPLYEEACYSGFVLNRDKREAVDLASYYDRCVCKVTCEDGHFEVVCADPIPFLTENSHGWSMFFLDGCSSDTTEELAGRWCLDELEIVDSLPEGYELLDCVFTEARLKLRYNYHMYGTDSNHFVLNPDGSRYAIARFSVEDGERYPLQYIKAVQDIKFNGVEFGSDGRTFKFVRPRLEEAVKFTGVWEDEMQ